MALHQATARGAGTTGPGVLLSKPLYGLGSRARRAPMFDSMDDLLIIAVIVVILFWGWAKIPQLAHSLGRAMGEFKKGRLESERELAAQTAQSPPAASGSPRVVRDSASGR